MFVLADQPHESDLQTRAEQPRSRTYACLASVRGKYSPMCSVLFNDEYLSISLYNIFSIKYLLE